MKKELITVFSFLSLNICSQENPTEMARPIVDEGKRLYQSEMASWYGTDLFLESYMDRTNIGGYFSYVDNNIPVCIFFSRSDNPKVIGTISFDSSYNTETAKTDLSERDFSAYEYDLYQIRKTALASINSDTLFKVYNNTNLNLIPLISGNDKKVYVLTASTQPGVVVFGNDYLLSFDKDNTLVSKKQLHRSFIPIETGNSQEKGKEVVGAMHTHLPETGDFITATDICTLMLYAKYTSWKQYNVVSKNYLNIWNCVTNELTVIPMSSIDKIDKDQKKKKQKNKNDK